MGTDALKIKLTTPLVAETRDWYSAVFALRIVEEWDEPDDAGCILALCEGSEQALLEIYHGKQPPDFNSVSLQFRIADADAFAAGLPLGVEARGPVERPWGSRYVYLTDPNGIAVIAYQGGY
jgi:catechol 2,3-dioxygenase-like lactoylglutathione lyase family enzyme